MTGGKCNAQILRGRPWHGIGDSLLGCLVGRLADDSGFIFLVKYVLSQWFLHVCSMGTLVRLIVLLEIIYATQCTRQ